MVVVEFHEETVGTLMKLLSESKKHAKKSNLALCELEEVIQEMIENSEYEDALYDELEDEHHSKSRTGMRLKHHSSRYTY